MTQNIQLSNIFACELQFGLAHQSVVIVASDKKEALEVLNFYYDEPEIVYLIATQELVGVLEELETKTDDFYMVILVEENQETTNFTHHYEWGQSLESLERGKYAGKDAVFLNRETTQTILNDTLHKFMVEPTLNLELEHKARLKSKFNKNTNMLAATDLKSNASKVEIKEQIKEVKILISDNFQI